MLEALPVTRDDTVKFAPYCLDHAEMIAFIRLVCIPCATCGQCWLGRYPAKPVALLEKFVEISGKNTLVVEVTYDLEISLTVV